MLFVTDRKRMCARLMERRAEMSLEHSEAVERIAARVRRGEYLTNEQEATLMRLHARYVG